MSLMNIIKYPDPFLKTHAAKVAEVDESVKTLIADMIETMYGANGIGLAAVQVGVPLRVIVLDVPDEEPHDDDDDRPRRRVRGKNLMAFVNPEVVSATGETVFEEGCLSLPGETANVKRAANVRVKALNKDGKPVEFSAEGLLAIALQHEIDHLDGVVFIDRISRLKREFIKRRLKKAAAARDQVL
ncbi:MAG: peptide deformylase [Deltaproteobacteria bacterium RIFCSPLOWO2_02_FULL_53_8]|nr:MAG: peptide deformylase [Deltaproteobacteria bacterium RIFCSPLOWO2_02_FULL_53_8]